MTLLKFVKKQIEKIMGVGRGEDIYKTNIYCLGVNTHPCNLKQMHMIQCYARICRQKVHKNGIWQLTDSLII